MAAASASAAVDENAEHDSATVGRYSHAQGLRTRIDLRHHADGCRVGVVAKRLSVAASVSKAPRSSPSSFNRETILLWSSRGVLRVLLRPRLAHSSLSGARLLRLGACSRVDRTFQAPAGRACRLARNVKGPSIQRNTKKKHRKLCDEIESNPWEPADSWCEAFWWAGGPYTAAGTKVIKGAGRGIN